MEETLAQVLTWSLSSMLSDPRAAGQGMHYPPWDGQIDSLLYFFRFLSERGGDENTTFRCLVAGWQLESRCL